MAKATVPSIKTIAIPMRGGIDVTTPHEAIKPGFVTDAQNFQAMVTGGYKTIGGYERTAGGLPLGSNPWYSVGLSDTTDIILNVALFDSVTGAYGTVVAKSATQVCLVNLSGNFNVGDSISGFPGVTVTTTEIVFGVSEASLYNVWQLASNDYFRNLINPVPGIGNVLGCWVYKDNYYAFRSSGLNVVMYRGNGTSWTTVTMYKLLKFNTGVLADGDILEGDTITGGTSGAVATVKRFIMNSGVYGSTAAGYMIVDVISGNFIGSEAIKKAGVTKATTNGVALTVNFTNGDNRFQFVNYNFYAGSDRARMYGCDGVNPAFEFDGDVLTPILLPGMDGAPNSNSPKYIEAHKNYLWLAFYNGSLQNSVLGEPLVFNGFLGAAEFGLGSEIKGMKSVLDNALIISTERQISALYGTIIDDFQLKIISAETSGIDYTCAVSVRPYMLSKKGIIRLDPTQAYGDFQSGAVSRLITPLINTYMASKSVVSAGISRFNNQYKLYFNDGTGIILTQDALYADQNLPQFTTFVYKHIPTCVNSVNVDDSNEVLLFGDKDGYVYREDTGNNCDGLSMEYALRTPFMSLGSPSILKRFKRAEFNVNGSGGSDIVFSYEFAYGQLNIERTKSESMQTVGSGNYWGSGRWGEMVWSTPVVEQRIMSITGNGQNISLLFYGDSNKSDSFTINSATLHFLPNRLNRG